MPFFGFHKKIVILQSQTVFIFTLSINYKMKKLLFATAAALLMLGSCNHKGQAAIENIMTRTSIRNFKNQPVEQEKIDILLKAAMAAPTAVNLQPWHFIVIDDKATIDLLSGNQPTNAPLLIALCGDTDKTMMPDGKTKLPDFWVEDVSAATENLLLAAHALGLGAVWTGVYPAMERTAEVANVLNCPNNIVPLAVVRVGYPDESPEPKNKFKEENISYNKFGSKKQ